MGETVRLVDLPGGDFVTKGLADLDKGILSEEGLLILIAGPRLRGLGFTIPVPTGATRPYEDALYFLIELRNPKGAHSAYNALIRRIVSFADSYSRLGT